MDRAPDAIVVGLGAHGSAAAAALARRGLRVLGVERFERGETFGSSGGRSRIIRVAHYENPFYAPLARDAWDRWLALEAETGETILTRTGGLYAGPASSAVVAGAIEAARTHEIGHELIDAAEIRRRWPAFAPADDAIGLVEAQAGVLRADLANAAHLAVAERLGAELRFGTRVVGWRPDGGAGFEVETVDGSVVRAGGLVLTSGPWISELVADLRLPLTVERQPVCWFTPATSTATAATGGPIDQLPVWLMTTEGGTFYGFPNDPELGLKVSHHHSGEVVEPDALDREVRPDDVERIRAFIRARMPAADGPLSAATVCLYTNTPDDAFIVDRHPASPGVAFSSACSGHGFKFAPLIGEILADLVIDGATAWPIEPFRADRFGR